MGTFNGLIRPQDMGKHPIGSAFKKALFYTIKLPAIFVLIIIGFIIDAIVHLPFAAICGLENLVRKKTA